MGFTRELVSRKNGPLSFFPAQWLTYIKNWIGTILKLKKLALFPEFPGNSRNSGNGIYKGVSFEAKLTFTVFSGLALDLFPKLNRYD